MIGDLLRSRYELTGLMGEGPIFRTYSAKDRLQGREVSVRLFNPPFDTERGFVAAVGLCVNQMVDVIHPGVERLEGVDDDMGKPYLVGQLSPELTLGDRIKKLAPFSKSVTIQTGVSILEGLEAIHQMGHVHGDINAQNIVISADGSARLQLSGIWEAYKHSQTAGAAVLPSMAPYLAPEVGKGAQPSRTSDVYSVGALMFELMCGRLPYRAETAIAMALAHTINPTPSITEYCSDAPQVLDEIIKKAMHKEPAYRYQSAGSFLSDLRMLQDALRFGKTLTWPIKRTDLEPAAGPAAPTAKEPRAPDVRKPKPIPIADLPVAPRLNSVKKDSSGRTMSREKDVPTWLVIAISLAIGVVITGAIGLYLFFNVGRPQMVTVPNLTGRNLGDARQTLQSLGLKIREVGEKSDPNSPINTILQSDPTSGEQMPSNGTVNVIVNSGPSTIQVPDLKGLTVDQATGVLKNVNLVLKTSGGEEPSDLAEGQIFSQEPAAKQTVSVGSSVKVHISNGTPPAPTTPTPAASTGTAGPATAGSPATGGTSGTTPGNPNDLNTNFDYDLKIRVTNTPTAVELRVDIVDSLGQRTILDETHDPKDVVNVSTVSPDPNAKFLIYYDGALKQSINVKGASQKSSSGTGGV